MIALLVGTIITLAALAFVLYPLFARPSVAATRVPRDQGSRREDARTQQLVQALREVEFDRATGKLSAQDYEELKTAYTREAVAAMRQEEASSAAPAPHGASDEELEAMIRRYRGQNASGIVAGASCPDCGPRPEHDAEYCSSCGRSLTAACPACATPITEPGARFCSACGSSLGAPPLLPSATH